MRPSSTAIIPGPARGATAGGVLLLLVVAAACGGRDSTASKSAAEFDRAQEKGGTATTTAGAHGGHSGGQEPQTGTAEAKGSAEMAGMDHSNMPGMDPSQSAKTRVGRSMAGMDHSNMPGMKPSANPTPGAMAGMDHTNMPGMAMAPPLPERPSVSAKPGQPAETLRPGDLDRPAPTSLQDAARAAAMTQAMAGGDGGMVHGTYSQTDAGRDDVPITSPAGKDRGVSTPRMDAPSPTGHEGHGAEAKPAAPNAPDPHAGHRMPAPRPTPSPSPSPAPKENR